MSDTRNSMPEETTAEEMRRETTAVEQKPAVGDDDYKARYEADRRQVEAFYDRQITPFRKFIDRLQVESDADRAERERRERSKRIVAAVSDGLAALSNLYFTTQYAPNAYNPDRSQLRATNTHIEKLRGDREANEDRYLNLSLKLGDLENAKAKTLRELEGYYEARKAAQDKAQYEATERKWKATLRPDIEREQKAKADRSEYEAVTAKAVADYAPEMQRKKGAVEDARASSYRSTAAANGARADYYRNGGSAGFKKHHFQGKEYVSEKDYTKDVTEAARQYNERHKNDRDFVPIVISREERTGSGGKRVVARKPEEYAGEVERRLAQEKLDNRPPSRRKNDNRPPSRQ